MDKVDVTALFQTLIRPCDCVVQGMSSDDQENDRP